MKKSKVVAIILAGILTVSSTATVIAAPVTHAPQKLDVKQELNISDAGEPDTLDFQRSSTSGGVQVFNCVMEGLTRSIGDGKIKPGIAEKWEASSDGLTWTFHLRDAKWTDGKTVTASDFVYGAKRALDPNKPADYGYFLFPIVGAEECSIGKLSLDKVGIKAVDEKTVVFSLKYPVTYFDYMVSNPVFAPARKDIVEAQGEKYNTVVSTLVTDGPFVISEWEPGKKLVYTKNKSYWDQGSIKLEKVNNEILNDYDTAKMMFKEGQLDIFSYLDLSDKNSIGDSIINNFTDGSVWYFDFNCKDKIMKNKNIRKALTLAINREEFLKGIEKPEWTAALSLVVPKIICDVDGKTFRENAPTLFKDSDAKAAKAFLEKGLKELKLKKLPVLTLTCNDSENAQYYANLLASMWKKSLGVKAVLKPMDSVKRTEKQHQHQYQISMAGWGPDYPDAMTFLDLYVTGGGLNDPAYSNKRYDDLIKVAKAETDVNNRSKLMHEAEALLMEDMPIGPIYYKNQNYALKNYVKNLTRSAFGADMNFIYAYIEGK